MRSILAGDAEDYRQSNVLGFFAVFRDIEARDQAQLFSRDKDREKTPSAVLDQLFIEQLGNQALVASIFKKHGLLLREKFDSDRNYERALMQLAATISILPPLNRDGMQRGESRQYWTLNFEFNDEAQWLAALAELKNTANKNARNVVKSRFDNLLASAKQKRAFDIEDLNTKISILTAAYEVETASRIAHLTEQAAIAKKNSVFQNRPASQSRQYNRASTIVAMTAKAADQSR